MKIVNCAWESVVKVFISFVPLLTNQLHKGQLGRVGVIGGSADYCGAPYYCGVAALRIGADLCSLFCAKEASIPIKSYSPELMVTAFYSAEHINSSAIEWSKIVDSIPRLHSFVLGPGLGRDPLLASEIKKALVKIVESVKP